MHYEILFNEDFYYCLYKTIILKNINMIIIIYTLFGYLFMDG